MGYQRFIKVYTFYYRHMGARKVKLRTRIRGQNKCFPRGHL